MKVEFFFFVSAAPLSYKSLENLHQNGVKFFLGEHFFSGLQGQRLQIAQLFPKSNTLDIFASVLY